MDTDKFLIRKAGQEDYPAVQSLIEEEHRIHQTARPDIFAAPEDIFPESDYIKMVSDSDFFLSVAVTEEGEIAGLCFARILYTGDCEILTKRKRLYIDDFIVVDKYRRRGIGRQLYTQIKDSALRLGVDSIELKVWGFNQNAVNFYRSLGMEEQSIQMEEKIKHRI